MWWMVRRRVWDTSTVVLVLRLGSLLCCSYLREKGDVAGLQNEQRALEADLNIGRGAA